MERFANIFIAGGTGMVGSAIIRRLLATGYTNLTASYHSGPPALPFVAPSLRWVRLDLTRQADCEEFFAEARPRYVFLAAAKVGGIQANNTYKADFIYRNLVIASNVIHSAFKSGAKKLLNLGSSCIYPKFAPQPMTEDCLLTGVLEPTNEPYAIAKIAAIKLCRYFNEQYGTNFISVMPTNLYGPNDNYHPEDSHVLAALIRKFHEAARSRRTSPVTIWGTGTPRREFLHVDDLAEACTFLMEKYDHGDIGEFVNIGTGVDLTITELALLVREITGFRGEIVYDTARPDGTPQKLLDISRIRKLGWSPKIGLGDGIRATYEEYRKTH